LPEFVPAISVSKLVFFIRHIEYFAAVAENQVVGIFLTAV
jgi:hypothetical protein